jgi:hypothetical protein
MTMMGTGQEVRMWMRAGRDVDEGRSHNVDVARNQDVDKGKKLGCG